VFLNQYGNRYKTPNWTFAEHCKRLGILGLRFHDLRHTAATRLAESGIDLFVMADILGHSDINMTRRYVTTTDARRRAAVEALARYGQSPPVPIETRDLAGE
jgi:integrase